MDWKLLLQIAGVVLGLLYLYLEYKASIWLWAVGVVMPVIHGILYLKSGLYADFGMQVYYVCAGVWGFAVWMGARHGSGKAPEESKVGAVRIPLKLWSRLAVICLVLHAGLYFFLVFCTDSTVPFWDSLTTALSIVAMWMLSKKYLEQWLVWMVVDLVTLGLYLYKGIELTACLYGLYAVLSVVGYKKWKEKRPTR